MKKLLLGAFVFLAASISSFAGDVAAFVDLGISSDGKTYIFGEYGRTDKKFQGYAEIYAVDIAKNDFIEGGIFRTLPSAATASKNGKKVYDELYAKAGWWVKKYNCKPADASHLLYVGDGTKSGDNEIVFKDFENSTEDKAYFYHVNMIKSVEGSGSNMHSSFYITFERKDEDGNVLSKNIVGSPDIKRKGVSGYKVERIFSDKTGKNLVFVIEKTIEDSTGTSIRYMVETIRL
ncbi:DUF2259 domain-containing protein [Treponema zioleckii]|uniref:DUF2259 domain-containing protein n=1 Tax=Treponema zioleckii TaxID=331680 RepID=UPI00168AE5BA|nr:DUF2259 domain-containing protein [Treponema zioleckii]